MTKPPGTSRIRGAGLRSVHRAGGGVAADCGLYLIGALFAGFTAVASTLPAHRAWGSIAFFGYAAISVLAVAQLLTRRRSALSRIALVGAGWLVTTVAPLLAQAVQRAGGHPHRAQEEVTVVELAAGRLLDTGVPYLTRDQISQSAEPLLSYLPYQPAMAVFGLPRALAPEMWWSDARICFALVTAVAVTAGLWLLRDGGVADDLLIRAAQAVAVLPVCALTLATGGDDLPVLAMSLLALALVSRGRWGAAGIAIGVAAALKLFAWPVAAVLLIHALATGRRAFTTLAAPALGIPVATLLPVVAISPAAVWENLVRFPLGMGLVKSPAASPLPGYLITETLPYGRAVAATLLGAAAAALGIWLLRRPPRTSGAAAAVSATGLLIAILLMPATRFGYLLYPAGYAVWAVALSRAPARPERTTGHREPAQPLPAGTAPPDS